MIRKYRYGAPFDTEALTEKIETTEGIFPYLYFLIISVLPLIYIIQMPHMVSE